MLLKNCRLYVIVDKSLFKKRGVCKIAEEALRGGADIIQLRDKLSDDKNLLLNAKAIRRITKRYKRLFIINDRPDIALIADADGVHLGQEDIPIEEARRFLKNKIIGLSTHNISQAKNAYRRGADYIGIGPIFKSKTKKALSPIGASILRRLSKTIDIPYFAIGGIDCGNMRNIKNAGAKRVAVASSATGPKDVYRSVKKLKEALGDTIRGR